MDNAYNRLATRRRRGQGGFTLIELLVVIAVLAILAAIVIFNVLGVTNRGSSSACVTDKATVQTAVDAYFNDFNAYPTAGTSPNFTVNYTDLTNPASPKKPYLHSIPPETFSLNTTNGNVGGQSGDSC